MIYNAIVISDVLGVGCTLGRKFQSIDFNI